MSYALLFLLIATPQLSAGHFLSSVIIPPKMVPIEVRIDFGPAEKPSLEKAITIRDGATPKEALKQVARVTEGKTCCHAAEVKGINGVEVDPLANRWWRLSINGSSKKASPHHSRLRAGDRMEWLYFEDQQ